MYRLIDLDQAGKETEGYVFLVSLGGEKVGFSDVEIAEMLRARPSTKSKKGTSRSVKGATTTDSDSPSELDQLSEPGVVNVL